MNILYAFFRGSFIIPDEYLPENKKRLEDSPTTFETIPTQDGLDSENSTDADSEPTEPTPEPKPQKKDTVLTPPVIQTFDVEL